MKRKLLCSLISVIAMLLLILDTKTAIFGVSEGISVCIQTLIPSLFPFLIISKFLSVNLVGQKITPLRPITRKCGIPEGFESVFLIGFIGGYPVGAHLIGDSYHRKKLNRQTANRILCLCNNAGPSFIFGMGVLLFESAWVGWCIWTVQIISAIIVGCLLPNKQENIYFEHSGETITFVDALESSVKSMGVICGWVVIFRVMITYLTISLRKVPNISIKAILIGILELSNGCIILNEVPSPAAKFVIMNGLLAFGGLCVIMQTKSSANGLNITQYISGKILQCQLSIFLSLVLQTILFRGHILEHTAAYISIVLISIVTQNVYINRKIIVASWRKLLYNQYAEDKSEA